MQFFSKVEVHFTRLETKSSLEKEKVACEFDIFTHTIGNTQCYNFLAKNVCLNQV